MIKREELQKNYNNLQENFEGLKKYAEFGIGRCQDAKYLMVNYKKGEFIDLDDFYELLGYETATIIQNIEISKMYLENLEKLNKEYLMKLHNFKKV